MTKKQCLMTKKTGLRFGTAILAALLVTSGFSFAAETGADAPTKAKGETGLMDANQAMNNPITSFTLFIVENDTAANQGKITTKNRYLNTTLIEPLIPISIGESGWNLINRPVIPIVSADVPTSGPSGLDWNRKSGLGDIVFFSMLKPPSTSNFQWGVGPTLIMPTATNNALGAEKWSTGPAAIALYTSPTLTYGALIQQWWSVAGASDRKEVSKMNLQYFVARQFTPNWGFISAPIIVADWKAKSGNKWSVPISAGIAYSFLIGKTPSRVLFEPQVHLVQPDDFGPNWNVRIAFAMVLPKLF